MTSLSLVRAAVVPLLALLAVGCGSDAFTAADAAAAAGDAPSPLDATAEGQACRRPAGVSTSTEAGTVGCWGKPSFDICEVPNGGSVDVQTGIVRGPDGTPVPDACHDVCSADQYALICTGEMHAIPAPDPSLGCTVIPIPTSGTVTNYCCPCAGGG
jgi:hypothetical protein